MSATPRPTPFDLVFGAGATERFAVLRAGLEAAGGDAADRDAFLLVREVAEQLRELAPEAALGAGVQELVAFLHHAFSFWQDGKTLRVVSEQGLRGLLDGKTGRRDDGNEQAGVLPSSRPPVLPSVYVQLPPFRVWGSPIEGQPAEPLDGWFARRFGDELAILAVFGLSPARAGFSVVEVRGPRPAALVRPDGSALFSATLAGGEAAGLASLVGAEELLELAWRVEDTG